MGHMGERTAARVATVLGTWTGADGRRPGRRDRRVALLCGHAALTSYAVAYADQTEADHAELADPVKAGRLPALIEEDR